MSRPDKTQAPRATREKTPAKTPPRAGAPDAPRTFIDRPAGKLVLVLSSVALLWPAYAPLGQFYLAWVGLVPFLLVVQKARSARSAFLWAWLAGTGFFASNMWWLVYVTGPGMIALVLYLGLYWSLAALVIRGARLLESPAPAAQGEWATLSDRSGTHTPGAERSDAPDSFANNAQESKASRRSTSGAGTPWRPWRPVLGVLLTAAVWVGCEWVRGTLFTGLPWLYLGHTQTPALPLCQIADVTGAYGVSFWVVCVNACLALVILHPRRRGMLPAGVVTTLLVVGVLVHGLWRMSQNTTRPGPVVMVVQPNFPQSNTGEKGADLNEIAIFHRDATEQALKEKGPVDLVVWSETMMPPINPESRAFNFVGYQGQTWWTDVLRGAHAALSDLARDWRVAILAGGQWGIGWKTRYDEMEVSPGVKEKVPVPVPADKHNSAYYYTPDGRQSDLRYDKVHLVPFGEFTPFKTRAPWLYRFFLLFNPYEHPEDNDLEPGADDALTVFPLQPRPAKSAAAPANVPTPAPADTAYRFVVPICFEDIDGAIVARMFRPTGGAAGETGKRADFIVNITNDGWFKANEMPQHLQAATFRSIENRAPTARSVNTGVSGFIDPCGRTSGLVPPGQTGASVGRLVLDSRLTFYTLHGDLFAGACAILTGLLGALGAARWKKARAGKKRTPGPGGT